MLTKGQLPRPGTLEQLWMSPLAASPARAPRPSPAAPSTGRPAPPPGYPSGSPLASWTYSSSHPAPPILEPSPASRVGAPGTSQPPRCSGPTSLTFLQSPSQQSNPEGETWLRDSGEGSGQLGATSSQPHPHFTVSLGKGVASPWELPPASAGLGGEGPGGEQNCPSLGN